MFRPEPRHYLSGGVKEGASLVADDFCIMDKPLGHIQHVAWLQNHLFRQTVHVIQTATLQASKLEEALLAQSLD